MKDRDHFDYSEDMFADTRMTFGEHLAELQTHLWRAIYGFLVAVFFSFFIGKAVLRIIAAPVTEQLEAFSLEHAERVVKDLPTDAKLQAANQPRFVRMSFVRSQFQAAASGKPTAQLPQPLPDEVKPLPFDDLVARASQDLLAAHEASERESWKSLGDAAADLERTARHLKKATDVPKEFKPLTEDKAIEMEALAGKLRAAAGEADGAAVKSLLHQLDYVAPLDALPDEQLISMSVRIDDPVQFFARLYQAQGRVQGTFDLSALSVQEAFMAYFKVSLACGLVLGSPWIFYQIWLFVAAGLYPHEKRLVNVYLPVSVGLFLFGVVICQFFVIPKAIEALLWFNHWIGMKPELRFNEWLGFAIMMPVVFGISFQLPLVMLFLERIGLFSIDQYKAQWRIAIFVIHVFAAVITPSVDIVSMELLALPMFGLYWLGIVLCMMRPRDNPLDIDTPSSEEMVEV